VTESTSPRAGHELVARVEAAADACQTRIEFLNRIAPLIRRYFGAWLAITIMPKHPDLIAVDSSEDGTLLDPELIRVQMQRSEGTSTAISIRLSDGRVARSLQINTGNDETSVGIAVIHFPDRAPTTTEQLEQLREMSSVCDAAQRALHALSSTSLKSALTESTEFASWRPRLREFHRSLGLTETAMAIAAESAWLVECDRVSILLRRGSNLCLQAVTGVDIIDRRGNESSFLEAFAERAIPLRKPLVYPTREELPPQIELPLADYLDQSLVQSGVLVPLGYPASKDDRHSSETIGVLIFERFYGEPLTAVTPAMQAVCDEASIAIRNAQSHQGIFLLPVWQAIHRWTSPTVRFKTLAAVAAIVGLIITLSVVRIDYKVTATGSIEPQTVRNVFASTDGVVAKLHVNDGQFVKQGDLLVEIENADVQRQSEEIAGEIQTTIQKLSSIEAVLVANNRSRRDQVDNDQMSIERHQLQTQLQSLYAQQAVIRAEKGRQSIHSAIDGQVIGWRLSQRLDQRPVSRGHRLFSVVDTNGPRVLRLQIADNDSGTVLEHAAEGLPLPVDFILATEPNRTLKAQLVETASATKLDAHGFNRLDAIANVTPDQDIAANMGAEVTAAIHCGRRSVLATWFGDVARFYHRHIRFYLE